MPGTIAESTVNDVTTVAFANPDRRNAVDIHMLTSLADCVSEPAGRVVILRGDDATFTAGADLRELGDRPSAAELEERLSLASDAIAKCRVPVIAAIEGPCLGAGVELAAACDIRVVGSTAFFEIPATRIGILYRPEGLQRLHQRLGSHTLRRLLLANERMSADAMGAFAAPVVAAGSAYAEAGQMAERVVQLSAAAVESTKALLNEIESGLADFAGWESVRSELWERTID